MRPRQPELRPYPGNAALQIGVSNYSITHLREIEAAGLPLPACNQLELHPWNTKPELLAFMAERNILPVAYSSLAPLSGWREAKGHARRTLIAGTWAALFQECQQ